MHPSTTKQPLDDLLENSLPYLQNGIKTQMNPLTVMKIEGSKIGYITAGEGVGEEEE